MAILDEIKSYSLTGESSEAIRLEALRVLRPHLPVSIPLYRRLQFGRFFDATCLLSNLSLDSSIANGATKDNSPWIIAFVDRSCRPETEVWITASWEVSTSAANEEDDATKDELVQKLILSMKNLPIPTSIHQDVLDAQATKKLNGPNTDHAGFSRDDYGGHASDANIMLCGAIHEKTVEIFKRLGLISYRFKTGLMANYTFIWDVDQLPDPKPLPEGLRWGELKHNGEHFPLVRSRTQIPRQDRTLAELPNLAIFPEGSDRPISWAFVGLDASLTTLHVEPEYRGKGLAKTITTKLFKQKMGMFWESDLPRLAHGYVISGNAESEGMCRSLGGKSDWDVYWLRADLGLV